MSLNRCAVAALTLCAGVASAEVAAENLSQQSAITFNWSGSTWIGQTFESNADGFVTSVDFALTRTSNTSGSIRVEIWEVSNLTDYPSPGNPGPTKLAEADASFSGLEFGVPTFVTADFSGTRGELETGGSYAIVFRAGPAYSLWVARGNPYASGRFFQWTPSFGIADPLQNDAYFSVSVPSPAGTAAVGAAAAFVAGRRRRV